VDSGVLKLDSVSAMSWLALIALGLVLGIGLSWSLIRARATGQVEVE